MPISYYVSAKKSTVVKKACVGNFATNDELNLIFERGNHIEVYRVTPEGLKSLIEIPIFGRVICMKIFRPKNEKLDLLAILTEKNHMAILAYENDGVVTRAAGCISDRIGRYCSEGPVLTIHPSGLIAVRIYEGSLKIVQWNTGSDLKHFNVRFEYLNVVDVTFMDTGNMDEYRVAYISEDKQGRHLRIVDLNLVEKEFKFFTKQENIEADSIFVIPIPAPASGVVILGQDTILYQKNDTKGTIIPLSSELLTKTSFTCFAPIDKTGERLLLSDDDGRLLMLVLNIQNNSEGTAVVKDMKIEYLGDTSVADDIVYLDNSVVFIASRLGDSQLIRLKSQPDEVDGSLIEVLDRFPNIGPIRDMIHVDNNGQSHLVTCSGTGKDGSLRIVRNGIGIEEVAVIDDLNEITSLYTLKYRSQFDTHIIASRIDKTYVLALNNPSELSELPPLNFFTEGPSLYVGQVLGANDACVTLQIVADEVRLMAVNSETKVWKPDNDTPIAKYAVNEKFGQVLVSARDMVYYLRCSFDQATGVLGLTQVASKQMADEVASLDMSNEGDNPNNEATFTVACMWNNFNMEIGYLPELREVLTVNLPTNTISRAVIATCFDSVHYLLVAIGDGTLFYYTFDMSTATLGEVKKAIIGICPPTMRRIRNENGHHIFVCSDRPVIIFSVNRKLAFSNVNVKVVNTVCPLNSEDYPDCIMISDGLRTILGKIDDIQKIHIRTIPIGESVRRVAHQNATNTYALLTQRIVNPSHPEKHARITRGVSSHSSSKAKPPRSDANFENIESEISSLVLLDDNTFNVLHVHEFGPYEYGMSLISAKLGDVDYYIVGTGIMYPDESEPKIGRLCVFKAKSDKEILEVVEERDVRGCAFGMAVLNGKLLVGVNSSVRLFEWIDNEFRVECSHFNNISPISIKTMGDQILVADIMRSVSLLTYRSMEGSFEEVAKDWNNMWTSACELITAERILGADNNHNLFTCDSRKFKEVQDTRLFLEPTGYFYLGELVTVMIKCSLVQPPLDSIVEYSQPIMIGTVEGAIGLIVQFDDSWKTFLENLQKVIADWTRNCLQIDHSTYRQYAAPKRVEPAEGFIDGDLIESILDISRNEAIQVLSKMPRTEYDNPKLPQNPSEILKLIEDLARIH
ncbi:unnamed protein product [Caenorhabditis bovis]|uniref:Damage-specific DNA-binding protein 1 n=1 Tax=Caenorhabditis bovis TaxID=2654633 RepID=A0A8S1FCP7_9PELO|nr:unnamed protein product [Caenorhabditis bovis]